MKRDGFTLIEILIVVSIIIILAAMLGGVFIAMMARGKNQSQANQLTKILGALEQFKGDFGEYPCVDTGSVTSANWATANALAFRLCQGLSSEVTTASVSRTDRSSWAGSYLTKESIASEQVEANAIKDIWGTPLAFCAAPKAFYEASAPVALALSSALKTAAAAWPVPTSIAGCDSSYAAYKLNRVHYARPLGTDGFMGPISYALKGEWIDSEYSMPEVWSMGEDTQKFKIQYNSTNTGVRSTNTGTGYNIYFYVNATTSFFYDKDNIGGNMSVMKVQ